MKLLNLGAGNRVLSGEGVVNHDISRHRKEIDVVHDLNILKWPWMDDEFDRIEFISVIEHLLINPIQALDECHRILKVGGELTVKYPLVTSETIWDDPTHTRFMSARSLEYVCPDSDYGTRYNFYTTRKWKMLAQGVIKGRNLKAKMTPIKG